MTKSYQKNLKSKALRPTSRIFVAGAVGIEPTSEVLETSVLPLIPPVATGGMNDASFTDENDFWQGR